MRWTDGRLFEGVFHYALHAKGGVHGHLGGNFLVGAGTYGATISAVQAFCPLAHDSEINGAGIGQGGCNSRVVQRGTQVDVVIQAEAQLQQ